MNIEKDKLGIFLAQLRKDRNLTQRELADKLYVSVSTISKWEKGVSTPNIYFLEKLAEALEVPAVNLIECQIDIGVEKEEVQEEPSPQAKEVKKRHRSFLVMLGAAILCVALGLGYAYYCRMPVEMETIEGYYLINSDFYNDNTYYVIVEYSGRLTNDMAINYAMEHQEDYEMWFEMADEIIFAFFRHYKGREHVMDANYNVVFVPYKGP